MTLNWFFSRTVRQASELRRHVRKLVNHQRDLLSAPALEALQGSMASMHDAIRSGADKAALQKQMDSLETAANKWLKPYPHGSLRENIEVFLVAIAVAVGIRTFFLQPFKIPTGSMQPTLYGVTPKPTDTGILVPAANFAMPNRLTRLKDYWFSGISYYELKAAADGPLERVEQPKRFLLFNLNQRFRQGGVWSTVWFPDDQLFERAGFGVNPYNREVVNSPRFRTGDTLMKIQVKSGDHLFVDRMSYNFRHPTRGEIIVFETRGISGLPQDQFYIKRMVGLGGERIQIGNDRHLVVDGQRLDAGTPRFEFVYGFDPKAPPAESQYSGHVNDKVALAVSGRPLAPRFSDETSVFAVPENEYIVMGDNTMNSHDSRAWGSFKRENVIGKSCFVYWPISDRFGWSHR